MAFNNCSYQKAIKIIEGIENNKEQEYNRYSKSQEWPRVQKLRNAEADRKEKPINTNNKVPKNIYKESGNIIEGRIEPTRKQEAYRVNYTNRGGRSKIDSNLDKRGYPVLNSREEEVAKGKNGVALGKLTHVSSPFLRNSMGYISPKRQQTQDKASEIRLQIIKNLLEHMKNNLYVCNNSAVKTGRLKYLTFPGRLERSSFKE